MADKTVYERILVAIEAALGNLKNATVVLNPDAEQVGDRSISVNAGEMARADRETGFSNYDAKVHIVGIAKPDEAKDLTTEMLTLYGEIVVKLDEDVTLGGLCYDLVDDGFEPMIQDKGEVPEATFVVDFTVRFQTHRGDPFKTPSET
ncbi:MAG: hypothetical protein MI755_16315 [Sphingomonadales bacterium]|nr:hypothetical protein [Sphingomonadales bacterium]